MNDCLLVQNMLYCIGVTSGCSDSVLRSALRHAAAGTKPETRKGMVIEMTHVKTLNKANLKESAAKGGCGNCQASCQSACKTSCTVANQKCLRKK